MRDQVFEDQTANGLASRCDILDSQKLDLSAQLERPWQTKPISARVCTGVRDAVMFLPRE